MRPNVEEIRERVSKATGVKWQWRVKNPNQQQNGYFTIGELLAPTGERSYTTILEVEKNKYGIPVVSTWSLNDAEFIAHSRTDIPALLTYIDELENMPLVQTVMKLQEENEVLRENMHQALGGYMSMCPECDGLLPNHLYGCALRKALEGANS